MNEVEAVKNRDTIKLISYLLERHFGEQMADVWNIGLNLHCVSLTYWRSSSAISTATA